MHPLDQFSFLTAAQDRLTAQVGKISRADSILILIRPELGQILAGAFIEAALLDMNLKYSRTLLDNPSEFESRCDALILTFANEDESANCDVLNLASCSIEIGFGRDPRARIGTLDRVAVAGIIAMLLSLDGPRVRKLVPLLIAGNWMRQSLDLTYDPVYTGLRDALVESRHLRLQTIAEVEALDLVDLAGIDIDSLHTLQQTWSGLDLHARSKQLSALAEPLLISSAGTARLEELIWHRLTAETSKVDIASQCSQTRRALSGCTEDERLLAADRLVDELIRDGALC